MSLQAIPFALTHLVPFAAIWVGINPIDIVVCIALYWIRMFAVTGGYHRHFSHRTFKTSRVFQFFLAFLAETSAQKGVLWWAAHHRVHHKLSDQPGDVHSPREGFWHSHMGWLFIQGQDETDLNKVKDLAKYPELMWLNRFWLVPPTLLAVAITLWLGWSGLITGFFLSTVLVYHGTFTINSLSHVIGRRRYETTDDSKNHWLLALTTMGEGWHNNHHHYQASTRQGFRWYEIDMTYYILWILSKLGIVWDLREPPKHIVYPELKPAQTPSE